MRHKAMTSSEPMPRVVEDTRFDKEWGKDCSARVLRRVSAKGVTFENYDFRYSRFDDCYFRACRFRNCDFTGSRFTSSQFPGTEFPGCKFEYASFDKTHVDVSLYDECKPHHPNQQERLARSLRVNYQQLGNPGLVNLALDHELRANLAHLKEEALSPSSYYRDRIKGLRRVGAVWRWVWAWSLDFAWGNGESVLRVARLFVVLMFLHVAMEIALAVGPTEIGTFLVGSFMRAPLVILGTAVDGYPDWYIAIVTAARLLLVSVFISVLVKRLGRR